MKRYIRRPLVISFAAALILAVFVWSGFFLTDFYRSPAFFWVLAVSGGGIVGIVIFLFLYWFFYRPITRLDREVQQIMEKEYVPRLRENQRDIFDRVRRRLNEVFREVTEMKVRVIEGEHLRSVERWEGELQDLLASKNALVEQTNRELSDRLRELALLNEISRTLTSSLNLDDVLRLLTNIVGKTLGYKEFVVLLIEEDSHRLAVQASYGVPRSDQIEGMSFAVGEGVSGTVAQTGKRILIRDTAKDPRYLHYKGKKPEDGSFLSIPVKSRGKVLGVFNFFRPAIDGFGVPEIRLLSTIANQAAGAIEKARLFEKVQRLSQTDDQTKLSNRRHALEVLDREIKRARRFVHTIALLMVEVDDLKRFRDRLGHASADTILVELAGIITSSVHDTDTVGRFGEESFLIILPRMEKKDALELAEKIRENVNRHRFSPSSFPETTIAVKAGVSIYPEDGRDPASLLHAIDRSLGRVKGEELERAEPTGPGGSVP